LFCRTFRGAESPGAALQREVAIPRRFQLPVDPKIVVDGYIPDGCTFMDSAKHPLFAAYTIAGSGKRIALMLKLDDDLTQDQLTLQLLRVMDSMWKRCDLDLRLTLYEVMPTGRNQGYIEIVPNAVTITKTQKEGGGATSKSCVLEWLQGANGGQITPQVAENFYRSLAGYCVAT
jgi:phosphatidylinositol-4,5-bisphosphate 3-kinase